MSSDRLFRWGDDRWANVSYRLNLATMTNFSYTMFFRLDYTIRDLIVSREQPFNFTFNGQRPANVLIREPDDEEQAKSHSDAFCEVTAEFKVSEKNEKIFAQIERNEVLEEGERWQWQYKGADGLNINLPSLTFFPNHLQEFIRQAFNSRREHRKRTALAV